MRLPQLQRPIQAAVMAGGYRPVLASFALPIRPTIPTAQTLLRAVDGGVEGRRYASVKSQGAYKIPNKKTVAKKLGCKRSGDQFVIPGNIIFKQRGTIWHAGFNAIRGRDHTIHAAATGYVKYYRDPSVHPDKQFIGVAFNKEDTLPYPQNEPRRRKLGMVATVRKPSAGGRAKVSDSGIPNKVLRKAGLYNIQSLERRLWNAEKRREIKEAEKWNAKAAKLALAAAQAGPSEPLAALPAPAVKAIPDVPTTTTAEAQFVIKNADDFSSQALESAAASTEATPAPAATANAVVSTAVTLAPGAMPRFTPDPNPKKIVLNAGHPGHAQSTKRVTAGEYLQKSWQERRHTKVLLLNPRTYAYAESNAAIGRLSSKTMYTAPWKLGGRKSRFRSRRKRIVAHRLKRAEDKKLVRAEREKQRMLAEKKRLAMLEKQRKRARKAEKQAPTATEEVAEKMQPVNAQASEPAPVEAKKVGQPKLAQESAQAIETQANIDPVKVKEIKRPVETQPTAQPVETQASAEPVAAKEIKRPAEVQETAQRVESKESAKPAEVKQAESAVVKENEQPTVAKETEKPMETKDGDKPVKS